MDRLRKLVEFVAAGAFIVGLMLMLQAGQDRVLDDAKANCDIIIALCSFGIAAVLMLGCYLWQRSLDNAREERAEATILRFQQEADEYCPVHDERGAA